MTAARRTDGPQQLARGVVAVVAAIGVLMAAFLLPTLNLADARAYWDARLDDPYEVAALGGPGAYLYAPAILQVLAPLKAMPWPMFAFAWLLAMTIALIRLVGPWAVVLVLLPPVLMEVQVGNIHLFLALAIASSLRWPGAWSMVVLTKPTLGIVLLWFLVRGEWRSLATAMGWTSAIVAVSALVAPDLWVAWAQLLVDSASRGLPADYQGVIHVPLWVRLPIAVAVVTWGARTDRPWTLAVAATLALPVLWVNGLCVLLAVPLLERWPMWSIRQLRRSSAPRSRPA